MTLHLVALQAEHGDCLVLEHRRGSRIRRYLIDGGPHGVYAAHLEPYLTAVAAEGGGLEAVVLSHVHNDHVIGLLDLLVEVRRRRDTGLPPLIGLQALWHNSFSLVPGDDGLGPQVAGALAAAAAAASSASGLAMPRAAAAIQGISEGDRLRREAIALGLPLNEPFPSREILAETAPLMELDGLRLRFVGPSRKTLEALREEWLEWLREHGQAIADGDPQAAAQADRSVPNLSSVSILATSGRRSVLLTGDGLGSDLLRNLEDLGIVRAGRRVHVDVLKLPHHGSERNVDPDFLDRVTADRYVISANGRDDNPDFAALVWLVEAIRRQGRRAQLVATNRTEGIARLVAEHPPGRYGYRMRYLSPRKSWLRIPVG